MEALAFGSFARLANAEEDAITSWRAQWEPALGLQKLGDEFTAEIGIAVKVQQISWASHQCQRGLRVRSRG